MNKQKIKRFQELVSEQTAGAPDSCDRIRELNVTLEDGYCLFNLFQEWRGAFSFEPGRTEALEPIRRLSTVVATSKNDDTMKLYKTKEWETLVSLRGPFECSFKYKCRDCGTEYVGFGQSGFDDRYPTVCKSCGDVWLQSGYDDTPLPPCACGGIYATHGCLSCGSTAASHKDSFSPYEYFANHTWRQKLD